MNKGEVGKSRTRADALGKVTGSAIYPEDIVMENMAHGVTLRSDVPHANITVDISEAEKMEGVVKIVTAKDIPGINNHGVLFKDHEVLCESRVRRVGDPIAFIVAETEDQAKEAMKKISVVYEELEAVFCPVEAMKEDAPRVHEEDTNVVFHYKNREGDTESAFKDCAVIAENEYRTSMVDHAFLQPEAGVSYMEEDGTIVIKIATQYAHFDRFEISEALAVPEEKIKIINTEIGGAFGGREDISMQIHLALATMITGRTIKCLYTREESFYGHSKRHPFIMKYKTGADKHGKLQAMEVEIIGDTGAYASWAINVLRKGGVHSTGPYEIPNVKVDSIAVYTNNPYAGAMRGFGATQPPIGHEQQMDILAEKLGMDPVEFRLKNTFKVDSVTANGQVLVESVPIDRCIEAVSKEMDFKDKSYRDTVKKSNRKKGRGIGAMFYGTGYGNGFPDISQAEAELTKEGKIVVYAGAAEVGQGCKTIMRQMAAEVLGVESKDIKLVSEDTSLMLDSGTAAASRQTYNTGNAVKKACEKLRDNIIKKGTEILKANSDTGIALKNENVFIRTLPDTKISFKEIAQDLEEKDLKTYAEFIAHATEMNEETGKGAPYWPYTFGACGVELEVDMETGKVYLDDAVMAQDVGRAINPNLIEGQMDGGFAMAHSYTIYEDLGLKSGHITNNKFSKYLMPTALDSINVKKIIIEDPESTAPFGAKGIGEPVMVHVAPAILNAIYDATGVRMLEIPVTPEKLLKAIHENNEK